MDNVDDFNEEEHHGEETALIWDFDVQHGQHVQPRRDRLQAELPTNIVTWNDFKDWKNCLAIVLSVLLGYYVNVNVTETWATEYRPCIGCGSRQKCEVISEAVPDAIIRRRFASLSDETVSLVDEKTKSWLEQVRKDVADRFKAYKGIHKGRSQLCLGQSAALWLSQNQTGSIDTTGEAQVEFGNQAHLGVGMTVSLPKSKLPISRNPSAGSVTVVRNGFTMKTAKELTSIALELEHVFESEVSDSNTDPSFVAFHRVVVNENGWIVSCDTCQAIAASPCSVLDAIDIAAVCKNPSDTRFVNRAISFARPQDRLTERDLAFSMIPPLTSALAIRMMLADDSMYLHLGHRTPLVENWARLLGFDRNKLLWGGDILIGTLLVPKDLRRCEFAMPNQLQVVHKFVAQGLLSTRFNKCLKDPETGSTLNNLVILLSEKDGALTWKSQIELEKALVASLNKNHFTFVTLSDIQTVSMEVILGIMSRAVAVIGPVGYMFGHTISSQPSTCLLQLLPSDMLDSNTNGDLHYAQSMHVALALGFQYTGIAMKRTKTTPNPLEQIHFQQSEHPKYEADPASVIGPLMDCLKPYVPQ